MAYDPKRCRATLLALAAMFAADPTTARAGFLDQLFGASAQAPQAAPSDPEDDLTYEAPRPRHHRHAAAPKHMGEAKTPKLQTPMSLMADKTLRPGDAVMLDSGLKVYAGPVGDHHDDRQFVTLGEAHIGAAKREALAALVSSPSNPAPRTGRSVAVHDAAPDLPAER